MLSLSSNQPKYSTSLCNVFYRHSELRRHVLTHTREKPYHCKSYEKNFSKSCHLNDHIPVHWGGVSCAPWQLDNRSGEPFMSPLYPCNNQ